MGADARSAQTRALVSALRRQINARLIVARTNWRHLKWRSNQLSARLIYLPPPLNAHLAQPVALYLNHINQDSDCYVNDDDYFAHCARAPLTKRPSSGEAQLRERECIGNFVSSRVTPPRVLFPICS